MPRIEVNEQAQMAEMERKLEHMEKKLKHSNRRIFSCFNCLMYFLALLLIGIGWLSFSVARSGLMHIPFLSDRYFSEPKPSHYVTSATNASTEQALLNQIKIQAAAQFIQGKDLAVVPVTYSEAMLTKMLQEYVNKNGPEYESAQIAVTDEGLELFLHKTDSKVFITAIVVPSVKDQKIKLTVEKLRLGNLSLPTSLGNIILKWALAQPLNALNAVIKNFGTINDITFSNGGLTVVIAVGKNSTFFDAF